MLSYPTAPVSENTLSAYIEAPTDVVMFSIAVDVRRESAFGNPLAYSSVISAHSMSHSSLYVPVPSARRLLPFCAIRVSSDLRTLGRGKGQSCSHYIEQERIKQFSGMIRLRARRYDDERLCANERGEAGGLLRSGRTRQERTIVSALQTGT